MIALFMSYVDLLIFAVWRNSSLLLLPCSLQTAEVLLLSTKGDQTTLNSLHLPKQAVFHHSFGSFGTFGSFSLGWPSLSVNLESSYLFSVSWFRHLSSWKTLHIKFHAIALCHLDSYRLTQITLQCCFPVCLHTCTVSPLHMSIQNTHTTVPGTVFKRYIHWMNEQNPPWISQTLGILSSMYAWVRIMVSV